MNLDNRGLFPNFALLIMFFFYEAIIVAHGMNKPGPHGGYINMPGAFHTELIDLGKGLFKVYLLDVNIKNSTVVESSVAGSMKRKGSETPVSCAPSSDYFKCNLSEGLHFESGDTLNLKVVRRGVHGAVAVYKFPLQFLAF